MEIFGISRHALWLINQAMSRYLDRSKKEGKSDKVYQIGMRDLIRAIASASLNLPRQAAACSLLTLHARSREGLSPSGL